MPRLTGHRDSHSTLFIQELPPRGEYQSFNPAAITTIQLAAAQTQAALGGSAPPSAGFGSSAVAPPAQTTATGGFQFGQVRQRHVNLCISDGHFEGNLQPTAVA
jgi:hypothetical protein